MEAVKARQASLRSTREGRQAPGYWDRRRPRYLLSGLMRCGTCDGGFVNLNVERFGCASARYKGTRSNRRTIRRDTVDTIVLDGLQTRLMRPKLGELFCQEYTKAMNRLRRENDAQRNGDRAALKQIDRDLDRLLQAILICTATSPAFSRGHKREKAAHGERLFVSSIKWLRGLQPPRPTVVVRPCLTVGGSVGLDASIARTHSSDASTAVIPSAARDLSNDAPCAFQKDPRCARDDSRDSPFSHRRYYVRRPP
ncbi:hypothetical protein FHP25_37220 [Vineibacter terrae]|uniref:Recombinase zinc beta ribbon domain-containing protein n=1 Tax=Vineibacter terrae TaxID=2586908 RepID=A0A5C8P7X3_9HYPH|nr:zinc ribbon domain-containing protein [Vineibacter terrae]TXL69874.1 hypothetical protein FHP25_37220 [Vineibacter terrae]